MPRQEFQVKLPGICIFCFVVFHLPSFIFRLVYMNRMVEDVTIPIRETGSSSALRAGSPVLAMI